MCKVPGSVRTQARSRGQPRWLDAKQSWKRSDGQVKYTPGDLTKSTLGDCFVVINCQGECWDGRRWVKGWTNAVQFQRPDPAYELCEQAARDAKRRTGVTGVVCYIPPDMPASAPIVPFPDLSKVDLRDLARMPAVRE